MSKKPDTVNPNSLEEVLDHYGKVRAILENRGGWYSVTGDVKAAHYYVRGNPGSDLVISLCVTQVHPIEKLHAPMEGQRCLVCSLLIGAGKVGDFQDNLERRRASALQAQAIAEAIKERAKQRKSKKSTKE